MRAPYLLVFVLLLYPGGLRTHGPSWRCCAGSLRGLSSRLGLCVSFFVKDRVVLSPSYSHGENKVKRKMRKIHKNFIFIFRLFSDGH